MFVCQITRKIIGPKIAPKRVVVETRKRTYDNYDRDGDYISTTNGWEIVKELVVDPNLSDDQVLVAWKSKRIR